MGFLCSKLQIQNVTNHIAKVFFKCFQGFFKFSDKTLKSVIEKTLHSTSKSFRLLN